MSDLKLLQMTVHRDISLLQLVQGTSRLKAQHPAEDPTTQGSFPTTSRTCKRHMWIKGTAPAIPRVTITFYNLHTANVVSWKENAYNQTRHYTHGQWFLWTILHLLVEILPPAHTADFCVSPTNDSTTFSEMLNEIAVDNWKKINSISSLIFQRQITQQMIIGSPNCQPQDWQQDKLKWRLPSLFLIRYLMFVYILF